LTLLDRFVRPLADHLKSFLILFSHVRDGDDWEQLGGLLEGLKDAPRFDRYKQVLERFMTLLDEHKDLLVLRPAAGNVAEARVKLLDIITNQLSVIPCDANAIYPPMTSEVQASLELSCRRLHNAVVKLVQGGELGNKSLLLALHDLKVLQAALKVEAVTRSYADCINAVNMYVTRLYTDAKEALNRQGQKDFQAAADAVTKARPANSEEFTMHHTETPSRCHGDFVEELNNLALATTQQGETFVAQKEYGNMKPVLDDLQGLQEHCSPLLYTQSSDRK
jgi:hypothetical protein